MHDDPMQVIYDGAEAAQDALHAQAGIEAALRMAIDNLLTGHRDAETMVWALVDSISHFRTCANAEVAQMQAVTIGRVQ